MRARGELPARTHRPGLCLFRSGPLQESSTPPGVPVRNNCERKYGPAVVVPSYDIYQVQLIVHSSSTAEYLVSYPPLLLFLHICRQPSPPQIDARSEECADSIYHRTLLLLLTKSTAAVVCFFFFSAPESERKPVSTLISQVFVYRFRFEPGSFFPPRSGLQLYVPASTANRQIGPTAV